MLAAWYKKQIVKEAYEKGRAEGFAEGRAEGYAEGFAEGRAQENEIWLEWLKRWEEWDQRRTDARKEGALFTEPRPEPPRDDCAGLKRSKRTGGE